MIALKQDYHHTMMHLLFLLLVQSPDKTICVYQHSQHNYQHWNNGTSNNMGYQ
jgi:hypothetical protein